MLELGTKNLMVCISSERLSRGTWVFLCLVYELRFQNAFHDLACEHCLEATLPFS